MLIVKRHTEYFAQDQNQIILFVQSVNIAQSSSLHLTLWRTFRAKAILSTIQLSLLFILDASSIHCWDSNPGPSEHESFSQYNQTIGKRFKEGAQKDFKLEGYGADSNSYTNCATTLLDNFIWNQMPIGNKRNGCHIRILSMNSQQG